MANVPQLIVARNPQAIVNRDTNVLADIGNRGNVVQVKIQERNQKVIETRVFTAITENYEKGHHMPFLVKMPPVNNHTDPAMHGGPYQSLYYMPGKGNNVGANFVSLHTSAAKWQAVQNNERYQMMNAAFDHFGTWVYWTNDQYFINEIVVPYKDDPAVRQASKLYI